MMGAAMLKHHQFVRSLWALYRLVVSSIMWGSQAQPLCSNSNEIKISCVIPIAFKRDYVGLYILLGNIG